MPIIDIENVSKTYLGLYNDNKSMYDVLVYKKKKITIFEFCTCYARWMLINKNYFYYFFFIFSKTPGLVLLI